MSGLRVHPRQLATNKAIRDLDQAVGKWQQEHPDLTDGEYVAVITEVFSGLLASWAKYLIRAERHPDDLEKPGGFE